MAGSNAALMTGGVRLTLASVALGVALTGCSDSTDTTHLWTGPERMECEGVAPMMCLQVAESEDGDYQLFYDTIEAFDYQVESLDGVIEQLVVCLLYTSPSPRD